MPQADFSPYLIRSGRAVSGSTVRRWANKFVSIASTLDSDNIKKFSLRSTEFSAGEIPVSHEDSSSLALPGDHMATDQDGGTSLISHGESATINKIGKFDTNITPDYATPKIVFNINGTERAAVTTSGWT